MDITFLGQSSFKIKGREATVVTDPYDSSIGLKFPKTEADIVTVSHSHPCHNAVANVGGNPLILTGPGEYEIKGVKIAAVTSFHDDKKGEQRGKNVIFNMKIDSLWVCHLGDLGQGQLTSEQMEEISRVDILLVPAGGVVTMDLSVAAKITAELEPKIVIPMHFFDPAIIQTGDKGDLELGTVAKFMKEMGAEGVQAEPKLAIKKDKLPEELAVVLLKRAG